LKASPFYATLSLCMVLLFHIGLCFSPCCERLKWRNKQNA
jgi:hypothetical protein